MTAKKTHNYPAVGKANERVNCEIRTLRGLLESSSIAQLVQSRSKTAVAQRAPQRFRNRKSVRR